MAGWLAAAAPYLAVSAANTLGNWFGQHQQGKQNLKYADYQFQQNMAMIKYQNLYNSPQKQMERFKAAGLNPHLIYNQGNPGNMSSAPSYPNVQPPNVASVFADLGTQFQQARLMASQADLTSQKVQESGIKQDLMNAQKDLVKANPYMRKEYVDSMVRNLKSIADLKEQQAGFMLSHQTVDGVRWERGFLKMQRELELLEQRFNLGTADQALKASVLKSKEFENALKQIHVNWMKEGDITPQHIYQGIMLLLGKLMR